MNRIKDAFLMRSNLTKLIMNLLTECHNTVNMEKPRRYQGAVDKEMICCVCLEALKEFKEPKELPCGHVNCKSCLEGLIQHSSGAQLTCPTCRSKTEVPNNDISSFPGATFAESRNSEIQGAILSKNVTEKLLVGHESYVIIELQLATAGKEFQFETSKMETELVPILRSDLEVMGRIESISINQIKVNFTPRIRGKHKLNVKVDGAQIKNSPFMLVVTMPPTCLTEPVCTLVTGLQQPTSVIYSKGKVLTTETMRKTVREINAQNYLGRGLKHSAPLKAQDCQVILPHQLREANGLAVDSEENLYISAAHQVQKFNRNESRIIKTVGCCGSGQAEFMNPSGLGISCEDELYVCDSNNHRIQVFDLELKFQRSFGSQGKAAGEFCYPTSIAFDSTGQIFIADSMNSRIECFSPKAECHLYSIEHKNLGTPTGLLMHYDHIYVADYHNHRITVMTQAGEFVTIFGSEHMKFPEGIAMDEDGFLYVTSDHSNIVIF